MEGHFDIKITASDPQYQEFADWVTPIATKLLEVFLNCWDAQLNGHPCTHNPRHEEIHLTGGVPLN